MCPACARAGLPSVARATAAVSPPSLARHFWRAPAGILRLRPRAKDGRTGGNRTPNPRFWRPVLCQLSYCPNPSIHNPSIANRQSSIRRSAIANRQSAIRDYFVSLCPVCLRQKRQYLLNSSRSLVFFLFFVVL
jgi:hypothetical protein